MTLHSSLVGLVAVVLLGTACSNGCGQGQDLTCTSSSCSGSGGSFVGDTAWKTDLPTKLADSSASATVSAIFGFASTPTSADSAEITATGGTIGGSGIVLRESNLLQATYPASKLISLAKTYTGSDIQTVTLTSGVSFNGTGQSGCSPSSGP